MSADELGNKITKTLYFGYKIDQMSNAQFTSVLESQLLLQLGDRLKRLRQFDCGKNPLAASSVPPESNSQHNVSWGIWCTKNIKKASIHAGLRGFAGPTT